MNETPTIFLAGTIDDGHSINWQHELMEAAKLHLAEFDDIHCKQPNYFIHKQGEGYNCMAYIERVREGESARSKDFNPFEDTL